MLSQIELSIHIYEIGARRSEKSFCELDIPNRVIETLESLEELEPGFKALCFKQSNKWINELKGGGFLVLEGSVGCGKTVFACYLALCVSKITRKLPIYLNAYDFHRYCYGDGEGFQHKYLRNCMVIDDMGDEFFADNEKGWGLSQWNAYFNHRYQAKAPTIITTNLVPSEFKIKYGSRIFDRLIEAGYWERLSGDSLRKPKCDTSVV